MEKLMRQVRILQVYAIVLTIIIIVLSVYTFKLGSGNFKQLTAERVNIVENTGQLRMVISNKENQHPGRIANHDLPKRDRPAGMIFFNNDGDECGGLVYDGDKRSASMTYSIDQYKNDQVMQLQYAQENAQAGIEKSYGLRLWDRSDRFTLSRLIDYTDSLKKLNDTSKYDAGMVKLKSSGVLSHERLFIGKNNSGEVGLFLADKQGNPRLQIFINAQNQPVIQTLDDKGKVLALR